MVTFVQASKQPSFPDSLQGSPHRWALTIQLYANGELEYFPNHIHIHMLPGVPSTIFSLAYSQYHGQENVRCTTRLGFIISTKPASMYTFVTSLTVVITFVKATANAEEVTR
jgi:hypothetical protein